MPAMDDDRLRKLYRQVVEENRREDEADLEAWYAEHHHWNHYDASDRASPGWGRSDLSHRTDSVWFKMFRRALGLSPTPSPDAPENPYRRYRYFSNDK